MGIAFDIRTLLYVGAFTAFACSGMLWLSRSLHRPSREALLWASASLAAFGGAMLLMSMRDLVPDLLSYEVANTLGSGAASLMYIGVRRIVGLPARPWLAIVTFAALYALHTAIGGGPQHVTARLAIAASVQGAFAIAAVLLLLRRLPHPGEATGPLRWAIVVLSIFAASHAVRMALWLTAMPVDVTGGVIGPIAMLLPTLFVLGPMVYALVLIGLVNGRLAAELWALATIDPLTGVRTRRAFFDEARRAMSSPGARPVLLLLDLDRFKQINDNHGHLCGDRVLERFASLLRLSLPADAIVGRYGGEEFCALLPDSAPEAGFARAMRICRDVRSTVFSVAVPEPTVTVSIGLADERDGNTLEALLAAADRRLYLAKATGRDRVFCDHCSPADDDGAGQDDTDNGPPTRPLAPRPAPIGPAGRRRVAALHD